MLLLLLKHLLLLKYLLLLVLVVVLVLLVLMVLVWLLLKHLLLLRLRLCRSALRDALLVVLHECTTEVREHFLGDSDKLTPLLQLKCGRLFYKQLWVELAHDLQAGGNHSVDLSCLGSFGVRFENFLQIKLND